MGVGFDDGKDAGALRTIGEVSAALGIKTHVLRYWEQQFPMLDPLKRSGGRRYYRPADVVLVKEIDRLVNREGFTLKGAIAALKGVGARESYARSDAEQPPNTPETPERSIRRSAPDDRSELVGKLKAIRATLAEGLAS
jgi:DNA-binding transcriptional MerR regulator